MLLGCIADDFTGASDLANTLAKGGMATIQFIGVPAKAAPENCEAGVVALKTRSIPAKDAVSQSLAALACEAAAGRRLAVVDAISDDDLVAIGKAAAHHVLVTGGSGIALGLPENFRAAGLLSAGKSTYTPVSGPGVVLSGSCSAASQA